MGRVGTHGHLPGTKFNKTGDFYVDLATGVYAPSWKTVTKFGKNTSVASGSYELIANLSGAYVWPQAATTVRVKAGGDAADTVAGAGARTLRIIGLNSDATAEIYEDVDLAGASASASTTQSFWRVYRAYVLTAGTYGAAYNTGVIIVENTAGTADLLQIAPEESQTQLLSFSLPVGVSAVLVGFETHVESTKTARVRVKIREDFTNVSDPISSERVVFYEQGINGEARNAPAIPIQLGDGPLDIWIEAYGEGAQTSVSGAFQLFCYPTP